MKRQLTKTENAGYKEGLEEGTMNEDFFFLCATFCIIVFNEYILIFNESLRSN